MYLNLFGQSFLKFKTIEEILFGYTVIHLEIT